MLPSISRSPAKWWTTLHSGFRTALACTIVGCSTLYGPTSFTNQVKYPAFAYVTVILIVSADDATLGDAIRGFWHASCATLMVMPLTIGTLRFVGPARFSAPAAALAVALTAFLVALPTTSLLTKRLAFGQIVIIYVATVIHGNYGKHDHDDELTQPLHVASSAALGAVASLLAMLLPYPRLAYSQVKTLCQSYAENAMERTTLYLNASISENQEIAADLIARAKPLAASGDKLLRAISIAQEGLLWEMPWIRFSKHKFINPADRFQELETSMKGMESALKFSPHLPLASDDEFTGIVLGLLPQLRQKLERATCFWPFNSTTVPVPETIVENHKMILNGRLSAFFFLSCVERFLKDSTARQRSESEELRESKSGFGAIIKRWISAAMNAERLLFASKCSISLGVAVLIGMNFNLANGYWSGLTIAISFATGKQAVFTVANQRAQGTAVGSVYGVLGAFLFRQHSDIRFIALLPWIVFTSFLRHSRMYGDSGGISADIGALLILGRHNYAPQTPSEFAIARLTEAVIGLTTMILVELLMQPVMASTLAKRRLYDCLGMVQECILQVVQSSREKEQLSSNLQEFDRKHHQLRSHVNDFKKFIMQAELEPNFWFTPFRSGYYRKLHESLLNMVHLLRCMSYNLEMIPSLSQNQLDMWKEKELRKQTNETFKFCNDAICTSLTALEKARIWRSYGLAQELGDGNLDGDLEQGNFQTSNGSTILTSEDKPTKKLESFFLQQLKKVTEDIRESGGESHYKGIHALPSFGFGISCFTREVQGTYKVIKELIPWERN